MQRQLPQDYRSDRFRNVGGGPNGNPVKVNWILISTIDLDHTSGHISWRCEVGGDEGVVSGWEGLIWDMLHTDGKIH